MSTVDFAAREVIFKIVYYGPGMSGKTTTLKLIHEYLPEDRRGDLVSVATEEEPTLFFDFMPLQLGTVAGFKTLFHLYTVPGRVFYNVTRQLVLRGVDGVIFVADSAPNRLRANAEALRNLRENLAEYNLALSEVPLVMQLNKRDLPGALPAEMLKRVLDPGGTVEMYEASAAKFEGVLGPLHGVSKQVLVNHAQPV